MHGVQYREYRGIGTGVLTAVQGACDCGWEGAVYDLPADWQQDDLTDVECRVVDDLNEHQSYMVGAA